MINTIVEFVEFPDCGFVAMNTQAQALTEIKRFMKNYFEIEKY